MFIIVFLPFPGRVGFGLNPVEGESEPEELEDALMGNTTSTFFPANQTATTSFQVEIKIRIEKKRRMKGISLHDRKKL